MTKHAFMSPSAAERWVACPVAPHRERFMQDTTSAASREGTAAHELYERCMKGERLVDMVGGVAENGIEFTRAMAININSVIRAMNEHYPGVKKWYSEVKVPIYKAFPVINDPDQSIWGTTDALAVDHSGKEPVLIIGDLKYGRYPVNPKENKQLCLYALGAMVKTEWRYRRIDIVVFQPRLAGRTLITFQTDATFIRTFKRQMNIHVTDVLNRGAGSAATPGSHCFFCKAAVLCQEKKQSEQEKITTKAKDAFAKYLPRN